MLLKEIVGQEVVTGTIVRDVQGSAHPSPKPDLVERIKVRRKVVVVVVGQRCPHLEAAEDIVTTVGLEAMGRGGY